MKSKIIENIRKDTKDTKSENNLDYREDKIPAISGKIFVFIICLCAALGGFLCFLAIRFFRDVSSRL